MRQHNKKLLVGVAAAVFLGLIALTVYLKSVWDYNQAVTGNFHWRCPYQ